MDTDKLYSISSILNHNFFYNYCLHHYNRVVSPELGPSDLNIGNIIHNKLREMHISHKELADKLGLDPSTVSKILKKEWIDTGKLVMISEAISYNFFEEYCMPINVNRSRIYYHRSIEELLPTNQEEYVKVEISLSTKTMEKIKYIAALTDWTTDELVYLGLNLFLKRYEESQMGKDKSETET